MLSTAVNKYVDNFLLALGFPPIGTLTMSKLWQDALAQLEASLNPQHFATWIKPLHLARVSTDLGGAMRGTVIASLPDGDRLAARGW